MNYIPQILFALILAGAVFFIFKRYKRIRDNISLGRQKKINDNPGERFKTMLLIAFGQKKMFDKPLVGLLHLLVYLGFVIINIEMLEIVIDGLFGTHRVFLDLMGNFYAILINVFEFLAVGVIISCSIFLIRRNVLKLRRFWAREMTQWPKTDANIILIVEIALMVAFLSMNTADTVLQHRGVPHYAQTGYFLFSNFLTGIFSDLTTSQLIFVERLAWWAHILGVLGFAIYITYSKHLHIFLAFPNTYFSDLKPKGKMINMPEVTREVKSMLGINDGAVDQNDAPQEIGRFGAKDINDLSWKNLMDAYSCTECGRCTAACPANITGKLLSPRKIMMDTRDRMEEVGMSLDKGGPGLQDGKALLDDHILREEIFACTSCQACVQACPVNIDPLSIILQIRRYITMEETKAPAAWNSMYSNIETNMAPWKFSPSDRFNWSKDIK
ncbi:MAG TPA: (Fe-S)-binding protein [Cytophagales bacterium]|nr:(Fe-S)-binding protein [Cytophagales bacterium]